MRDYLIRRILLIIPTLIGVTLITFLITRAVPGGPVEQQLLQAQFLIGGESGSAQGSDTKSREGLSEEDLRYLKEFYGFDKPAFSAYLSWLWNIVRLDLGESYRYQEPVVRIIAEKLPVSIYYGLVTTLLTYVICVIVGIMKAVKNDTWIDGLTSVIIFAGYAMPSFVLGLLLLVYFGGELEWFPMQGFASEDFDDFTWYEQIADILYHSVLPLICYLAGSFASMTILVKNSMLENLGADYIRAAYAKGLPPRRVIFGHAFRNSLIPLAATFGNNIGLVLTGSFLIETIFNIDGLGLLGFEALTERDYPVVMGTLFISSLLFLVGNILSDICIALVDPRIKFR